MILPKMKAEDRGSSAPKFRLYLAVHTKRRQCFPGDVGGQSTAIENCSVCQYISNFQPPKQVDAIALPGNVKC